MSNVNSRRGVVLDTSAAIDILDEDGDRGARRVERVPEDVRSAAEWVLPVPVVGELKFGALNSERHEANLSKVNRFLARCRIVDSTATTAAVYATVRLALHRQGQLIPENDLWIAASSLEADLPLATSDPHFDSVPGLAIRRT